MQKTRSFVKQPGSQKNLVREEAELPMSSQADTQMANAITLESLQQTLTQILENQTQNGEDIQIIKLDMEMQAANSEQDIRTLVEENHQTICDIKKEVVHSESEQLDVPGIIREAFRSLYCMEPSKYREIRTPPKKADQIKNWNMEYSPNDKDLCKYLLLN